MYLRVLPFAALLALIACDSQPQVETDAATGSVYQRAVDNPSRPAADRARDGGRKPAQVLEFFGIQPGMTVLDLFSGGGYYSELLSYVVGPEGRVVAHSNSAYMKFVGEEVEARYSAGRLDNVEILMAENNELHLPPQTFDAVLLILSYHDLYYVAPDNGWSKIDGPKLLAEIYQSMRPGGILGVVDHYAEAGSPRETGNTVHRIDPGIVVSELETAGFGLDGKSNILRNMDDDYSRIVYEPPLRGKTDRFVLRFRKPG